MIEITKEEGKDTICIYSFRIKTKDDFFPTERNVYSVSKYTIGNHGEHIPTEYIKKTIKFFNNLKEAEKFLDSHKVREVDWYDIISNVDLSEKFIRKYMERFQWLDICAEQKLSESFVREFKDFVKWEAYLNNIRNKFSLDFIYEMKHYTEKTNIGRSFLDKKWKEDM